MQFIKYNDEKLSKLSLGTVQFGLNYGISNKHGQPLQKEVDDIIDYVIQKDINCFDTAQAYGTSEEVLGIALKKRKDVKIISKLKSDVFTKNALENLKNSLHNLKVDSLYALLLHDASLLKDWDDSNSNIVNQMKTQNLIKNFGVSIYDSKDFDRAIDNDLINFIQIPFNIFDQRALSENWFQRAKEKNKLIFIRSIYLQGLLLMEKSELPHNLKDAYSFLDKLEMIANDLKLSKNELALSFVNSVAKDSIILFGCDNLSQAKENIDNFNNLKILDKNSINLMIELFKDISEDIYNPTRW